MGWVLVLQIILIIIYAAVILAVFDPKTTRGNVLAAVSVGVAAYVLFEVSKL